MVYQLIYADDDRSRPRLVSQGPLTPDDFSAIATELAALGWPAFAACKTGLISVEEVASPREVTTEFEGQETVNRANPGDWIATNMDRRVVSAEGRRDPDRFILTDSTGHEDRYVIANDDAKSAYRKTDIVSRRGPVYERAPSDKPLQAIPLAGGFDIIAPWGQRQSRDDGYLILNGTEVYGIFAPSFEATYERLPTP